MAIDTSPLWDIFNEGKGFGLIPDLPLDAALARLNDGDNACTPRLVELTVNASVRVAEAATAMSALDPKGWSRIQRRQVENVLDQWWKKTLESDYAPDGVDADESNQKFLVSDVLGILVGYPAPIGRWLRPWLEEHFDGVGAAHFADMVTIEFSGGRPVDGSFHNGQRHDVLVSPAWDGKEDQCTQVLAWAKSEPVVMGFTIVGGVHVGDGVVGRVLDVLI